MQDQQILPDVVLQELANKQYLYSGIDSIDSCRDKNHFLSYSHNISYYYNNRGFRDNNWPESMSDLRTAVWCLGDSFTVGIGSPLEHTWPNRLSSVSKKNTLNVSMDGASNEWIARKCCDIYNQVSPDYIVIMWSYLHRRESNRVGSDLQRRLHFSKSTITEDYNNFIKCRQQVKTVCKNSKIVELIIPGWEPTLSQINWEIIRDPSWPELLQNLQTTDTVILNELKQIHKIDIELLKEQLIANRHVSVRENLIIVPQLDLARDGHHFDLVTSNWVVDMVTPQLDC